MPAADTLTLGVEEEFLLVDRAGRLATGGPEVSRAACPRTGFAEHELKRCQVESASGVYTDVNELLAGLRELRGALADGARRRGLRLLPSATAVLDDACGAVVTRQDRYERMAAEFGEMVRESLTCACHVHVGIPDRATGLVISNALRPWLPVLLALMANSPFHDGVDTGYASWRHAGWSAWPSAGPPPRFASVDEYESLVEALARSGAIIDRGMIYWDVRLSAHAPTLEIRVADVAPSPEDAALLAVLVRGLAARALTEAPRVDRLTSEELRGRLWRASRDGLSGGCPRPTTGEVAPTWQLIDELFAHVEDELRASNDDEFVKDTLGGLRSTGCGADRQRAAFARRHRLGDVVDALALPATQGPA